MSKVAPRENRKVQSTAYSKDQRPVAMMVFETVAAKVFQMVDSSVDAKGE